MKKFFAVLIFVLYSGSAFAVVESDVEIHKVVGGLYSLSAAIELNAKTNPTTAQLQKYFENLPQNWFELVKISKTKKSIWVGIAVEKNSTARKYLRSNSERLKITSEPDGYAWLGEDFAWLKAADIVKGKLKPIFFGAAEGDGTIFFRADDFDAWWEATPKFNSEASKEILKKHEVDDAPILNRPSGSSRVSIYDSVKPNTVIKVPDEIHMGHKGNSFDVSVGDVIFNPIPTRRNN